MQWYYAINGQRQGPVIETEFERLVRDGIIRPETLVWRQGMPEWVAYSQIPPVGGALGGITPPVAGGAPITGGTDDDTAVCAVSGQRHPKREMIQYEGKWVSAEHRDVFFQRIREGVAQPTEHRFAGFGVRFWAKLIDFLILLAVSSLTNLLFGVGLLATAGLANMSSDRMVGMFARQGMAMLVNMGLAILYSWFFLSRHQATPGKMAFGLKVIRSDGSALSTGRIIARYFAELLSALILYIGYLMVIWDDEKRALHDQLCDTRVIRTR